MKKFRWRIYTELIYDGYDQGTIVSEYFQGYTVYNAVGVWKGETESSITFEIIGDEFDRIKILELSTRLRDKFEQESVLVTEEPVTANFI